MRARGVILAVAATGLLSLATVLTGLITNEASAQRRWPGFLEAIRTHPWPSLTVLAVLLVGLTILVMVSTDHRPEPTRDDTENPSAPASVASAAADPLEAPTEAGAQTDPAPATSLAQPSALAALSAELVSRLGRRRTAYPLDLSLAELHRLGLFVTSRLSRYYARHDQVGERAVTALVSGLRRGESVLLLGEPGSGKSLSLYGVALELQRAGRWPLPIRALEAAHLASNERWLNADQSGLQNAVVLVDGLDEASDPRADTPLTDALLELLRHAPALVTSRTREYEEWIVYETTQINFDEVFVLNPWSVELEFTDYLDRLGRHGLLADRELLQTVVASERLARLVSRPLYARMLTFVGDDAAVRIASASHLYGEYLSRLSRATDHSIRVAHPAWRSGSMATWQQAAWYVHSHGLAPDAIPMSQLETALPGGDRTPTIRALDQIIDRRTLHGTVVGEFIHYSFYEYLLARQIRDGLTSNVSARQAINLLRRDLSREIRHHLVGQLQDLTDNELGDRLCVLYGDVRVAPDLHPADRLTVCNLLVYLVSRTSSEARRQLDTLLAGERDAFLLNSLLWALCHHRSMPALEQFFALLQQDATFRACSRGYVLYYYGDIRTGQPPFLDDLPYRSHERTSSKVLAIFEDEAFLTVPPQRRYIDLYTFMDIYLVRREKIDDRALSVLQPAVDALGGEDLTSEMKDRLTDMLREISRRPIPDPASTSFVSSTQQEAERP